MTELCSGDHLLRLCLSRCDVFYFSLIPGFSVYFLKLEHMLAIHGSGGKKSVLAIGGCSNDDLGSSDAKLKTAG